MKLWCFRSNVLWCECSTRRRNSVLAAILLSLLFFIVRYLGRRDNTSVISEDRYWESPVGRQHFQCDCDRYAQLPTLSNVSIDQRSTCGPLADVRGPHQRVVTFSFYGPTTNVYYPGIARNVELIKRFYPGWVMRVYHRISSAQEEYGKQLCDLVCSNPTLDECFVDDLDERGIDMKSKFGMIWRFMPLGDPLVDVFSCRDLDSTVQQREVDAVNQWLKSNKTFHSMRDHPAHKKPFMGCGWGAKNSGNFSRNAAIRNEILKGAKKLKFQYGYDEELLRQIVYPKALGIVMIHDSYNCKSIPGAIPFPTKRTEQTFVGSKDTIPRKVKQCPKECRPKDHQNWLEC